MNCVSCSVVVTTNFGGAWTCRAFVRPPGGADAKFHSRSKKGVFLGFPKNTAKNIVWDDPETDAIKIAKHARFDEGMSDLPIHELPPNALQLHRLNSGEHFPAEDRPRRKDQAH